MTVNISNTQFDSRTAGLANYETASFYIVISAYTLAAWTADKFSTQWSLDNADAVSQIQINYSGIETAWRVCSGSVNVQVTYGARVYDLMTYTYYEGGYLKVDTFVINQTGSSQSIPNIAVNVRAFLYNAPF